MSAEPARVVPRLQRLIDEATYLTAREVGPWVERARLAVAAAYGDNSSQLGRFDDISYSLGMWTDSTPDSAFDAATMSGARTAIGMLEAFVEDLSEGQPVETRPAAPGGRQVFVVHGRDEA